MPGLGGSEEECEAFYIPPDQESNSLNPYSNTFNVTGPIDWSKSGGSNSLDRFRAIGTHNSYHVQQYEVTGNPRTVRTNYQKVGAVDETRIERVRQRGGQAGGHRL